jgi:predicted nucleic acid-binding protein
VLTRTYIDSGVLIHAAKGTSSAASLSIPFISDPAREYVTSDYVRLEVLPKATFHKNAAEVAFYKGFFTINIRVVPPSKALLEYAMQEAEKTGMSGFDAIHVAAAVFAGAHEFITTEKNTKPIHRTKLLKVVAILP